MKQRFVSILDIPIIHINHKDFINVLKQRINNNEKTFVVTANPIIVMKARKEIQYRQYIEKADFVTADGSGIVLASRLLNNPLPGRVTGFDMMLDLLQLADLHHYRVYFLGAQQSVIDSMVEKLKHRYPNLNIVGSHNGFFEINDHTIIESVQSSKPDLIFVALGVPKQEQWIAKHLEKFEKGIFIGIGGSFDIIAGTVKRAPNIWIKLNLEWLYRLIKQPSRWKRMLALPHFALKIIIQKINWNKVK